MLTKLKAWFQRLTEKWANAIQRLGLNPSMISILGLILGISSGVAYWLAGSLIIDLTTHRIYLILAVLLLSFSGLCDALDGALARIRGEVTAFGGFLDSIVDRYVDSAVLLGIMLSGLCDPTWGALALVGSLLTSYVRAKAESLGIKMESIGLIERAERVLIILISSAIEIIWPSSSALSVGIMVLAVTSNLTVVQRILHFYNIAHRVSST
ncbi:MAG: archaetidylinositol phosphate synthase [Candidatus Nezhaarchaeota archaeon]|nr:archaetidylinositol phosphate synthase [Candidatus Nezhaarchaeota archaeon]